MASTGIRTFHELLDKCTECSRFVLHHFSVRIFSGLSFIRSFSLQLQLCVRCVGKFIVSAVWESCCRQFWKVLSWKPTVWSDFHSNLKLISVKRYCFFSVNSSTRFYWVRSFRLCHLSACTLSHLLVLSVNARHPSNFNYSTMATFLYITVCDLSSFSEWLLGELYLVNN